MMILVTGSDAGTTENSSAAATMMPTDVDLRNHAIWCTDINEVSSSYFFPEWQSGGVDWGGRFPCGAGTPASSPAWSSRACSLSASSHSIRRSLTRPSIARFTALEYAANDGYRASTEGRGSPEAARAASVLANGMYCPELSHPSFACGPARSAQPV